MRSLLLASFLVGSVLAAANSTFSCDSSNNHCPTGACLLTKSGTCFISSCAAAGQCKNLKNCSSNAQKCCCKSSNCYKNVKLDICEEGDGEEDSEEKSTPKNVATKPAGKPAAPHFKNATTTKSAPATKAPAKVASPKKTSPPKTTTTTEPPTTTEEEEEETTTEETITSEETTENPEETTTTDEEEENNSEENELSKVTELEEEAESTTEETTTTEDASEEEEASTTEEPEETTTEDSEEEETTTEEPEETTTEEEEETTTEESEEVKPVTKPKKKSVKSSSKSTSKQSSKSKKPADDENESNEAHPVASTKDKSEEDQNDSDDDDTFMHPRSRKLPAPIHASAAKKHSAPETTTIQVTTSAMTNSKALKEKAGSGLPWWSAALLGLILAAAVFCGAALWLKRRKEKMIAMNSNRRRSETSRTDKLVDPLLLEKQKDSQA